MFRNAETCRGEISVKLGGDGFVAVAPDLSIDQPAGVILGRLAGFAQFRGSPKSEQFVAAGVSPEFQFLVMRELGFVAFFTLIERRHLPLLNKMRAAETEEPSPE